MELVDRLLKGDKRAAARLITLAENRSEEAVKALQLVHAHTGGAHIIGVTGPPGGGKSTVVDRLAKEFRKKDKTIGIIAVDPSSPFTGGALLGDRIRMSDLSLDENVFIRSMGTRGSLGGLARATGDTINFLDALGKDVIIVETVGAGQAEIDIVKVSHTVLIITVPGLGDDIQAIKAGMMEIGDIFVVNKADRGGAEKKAAEIEMMLDLNAKSNGWKPPVLQTNARDGDGIKELFESIIKHRQYLEKSDLLQEKLAEKAKTDIINILNEWVEDFCIGEFGGGELEGLVSKVIERELDPYTAADTILNKIKKDEQSCNIRGI
jgi:LAO/AO transport system kinase